jgi:hypothetical protein
MINVFDSSRWPGGIYDSIFTLQVRHRCVEIFPCYLNLALRGDIGKKHHLRKVAALWIPIPQEFTRERCRLNLLLPQLQLLQCKGTIRKRVR